MAWHVRIGLLPAVHFISRSQEVKSETKFLLYKIAYSINYKMDLLMKGPLPPNKLLFDLTHYLTKSDSDRYHLSTPLFINYIVYSTKKRASLASAMRADGDWHTRLLLSTYPISPHLGPGLENP